MQVNHGCCPHCLRETNIHLEFISALRIRFLPMLMAAWSLPCILAVCQLIDTFYSSTSFYCCSWVFFFCLGFVVVPCLLITHQLAVWERIVWFKHLLLFRRGRRTTHGWQGSSSRYQRPRSPECMCQIREEHRRQLQPKAPCAGAETHQICWMQAGEERVQRSWGVCACSWPHQQDGGRQRDSFHPIKLANFLPCRTGIVIQTLSHWKLMIYHSSQPTQTDTRDLWAINW